MKRDLGGGPHHEPLVGIQPSHRDVRLDGALLDLVDAEGLFVAMVGRRQSRLHVAPLGGHVVNEVACGISYVGGVVLIVDHRGGS